MPVRCRGMKRIFLVPLLFAGFLSPLRAEPDWDSNGVRKDAAELLKQEDFAALDQLVTDIKRRGYDIRQTYPELRAFYSAFGLDSRLTESQWLDQQGRLERWGRARPESLSAKIALADWYIGYGWKARGTAYSDRVTDEGWKLMGERLRQATRILKSVPEASVNDPEYYRLWIPLESEPSGQNAGSGKTAFQKGTTLAKEYYPLYSDRAYFLLPKWYGAPGDWERFLTNAANAFPSEKGDILYARVARAEARHYGDGFFKESKTDYTRVKRGYLAGAVFHGGSDRISDLSNLCYLAAIQGDRPTAAKLFLDLGDSISRDAFGDHNNFLRLRQECGVEVALQSAINQERAGRIDEAEKTWTAFHPDTATSPWLPGFYLRQGIAAKLRELAFKSETYGTLLDTNPADANPDTLAELAKIAPQVGDWDKAEAAARGFDQKRPFNLIGKNTLWLCALHAGDKARAEAVRRDLLALQTKRPAYLTAQAVLSGTKTWEQARPELNPQDAYIAQGVAAIALHYYTEGQPEAARKALTEAIPLCLGCPDKTLLESMLYGSLGRWLNPPPSPAPTPAR